MINIVIVGGGFGGLQTALKLEKKFRVSRFDNFRAGKDIAITLIDKRDYHLFTPNLYEAATAAEEITTVEQIKKSISLPFKTILKGKKINFIKAEVVSINLVEKTINLPDKKINFDYLVLALGSKSDFFNLEGVEKFALPLKDLPDALRARNKIEFAIEAHKLDFAKPSLRIVVAGGGYTGVELAGELRGLLNFLSWKNAYPKEKIEIEIVEAASSLVQGFDPRLSRDAWQRLQEIGVRVSLSARIAKVDEYFVELASGEKIAYDILFWTTGVKAFEIKCGTQLSLDKKNRLYVNEFFQVENHQNVFALGDMACILGANGQPVPSSAQDATDQAHYLAYALPYIMRNQKPRRLYKNIKHGFIVNVGGKWAIMSYNGIYITGFFAFVMDKFAHLRYYLSIVGVWKAVKCIIFQTEIYSRND